MKMTSYYLSSGRDGVPYFDTLNTLHGHDFIFVLHINYVRIYTLKHFDMFGRFRCTKTSVAFQRHIADVDGTSTTLPHAQSTIVLYYTELDVECDQQSAIDRPSTVDLRRRQVLSTPG